MTLIEGSSYEEPKSVVVEDVCNPAGIFKVVCTTSFLGMGIDGAGFDAILFPEGEVKNFLINKWKINE